MEYKDIQARAREVAEKHYRCASCLSTICRRNGGHLSPWDADECGIEEYEEGYIQGYQDFIDNQYAGVGDVIKIKCITVPCSIKVIDHKE